MRGLRKLERDYVHADLAAVNALLDQLTEEDVMVRFSLEARRDELKASVEAFGLEEDENTASAALFFGGRPVIGARGIESEFGGTAVTRFQDLVAKLLAQEGGSLGQRGIVPNKAAATLHITNVVRGSFGFLLEEVEPQGHIVDTALKTAVDSASKLLNAFGEVDEERFQAAVETVDQRALTTARDFFDLVRQGGATFRLVAGEADMSFGSDAIARAADRATSTTVEELNDVAEGQLGGVLPDARLFEFRTVGPRGTIRGKVDKNLASETLAVFNRTWVNLPATADLQIKRVLRNGQVVRESFTLRGLKQPS